MSKGVVVSAAVVLLLVAARPAAAEVSDKIATIPQLWLQGGVLAACGFLAGRFVPWLGVVPIAIALLLLYGTWSMLHEPYLGDAVRLEQGTPYVASAWFSALIPILGTVLGIVMRRRRLRQLNGHDA